MKKLLLALLVPLLTTGCFEIEQSIDLQKNLSGTADFHLGVDLEPMVVVMAQFAKEMEGKKGPLTAAELARAKAEFSKSKSSSGPGEPPSRAEIEKGLPEGVDLLDMRFTEKEFGVVSDFKFAFDRINHLVGVKFPSKEGGDPTQKNIIETPFEGLELVEKGDALTIRSTAQNPVDSVKEQASEAPKMDAAMEKLVREAFGKMRVVYRITAPFAVVSHNATRKDGNTLVWEYDLERFEELQGKSLDDLQLRVTYRR